jgi:DNA replication ATP-dependent helicase Dna2
MLSSKTAKYFYEQLSGILAFKEAPDKKIIKFHLLFKELLDDLLINETRSFSSYYSRFVYISDILNLPDDIIGLVNKFRYYVNKISSDDKYFTKEFHIKLSVFAITRLINFLSDEEIPENISGITDKFEIFEEERLQKIEHPEKIDSLKCVINEKVKNENDDRVIICFSQDYKKLKIKLLEPWKELYHYVWKGSEVNLVNIYKDNDSGNSFRTGTDTLISLEPDYLMDATELAECFLNDGSNPKLYFLKKFTDSKINENMIVGNFVNFCLDELLNDINVCFEEVFTKAINYKPIPYFALTLKKPEILNFIREKVKTQFKNLKDIIRKQSYEIIDIEPTFISPEYGLQGRLDVMLSYYDDPLKKDIIELKSGKAPSSSLMIKTSEGKKYLSNIWNNHLAQTTCYNLLLDSTYPGRRGVSEILYSDMTTNPRRDSINIIQKKQELLKLRNRIISYDYLFRIGDYSLLKKFDQDRFGVVQPFSKNDLIEFENSYLNADEISREYFESYVTFILNEIYASKLGSKNSHGFSSLWKESIKEKENSYSIITGLYLDGDKSDFHNGHLFFHVNDENPNRSSFRKGDIAILYYYNDDNTVDIKNKQLLKCVIKEINDENIKISLRNKLFDKRVLKADKKWIIERDYLDTTNKKLLNSVYTFLQADIKKRKLILGLLEPELSQNIKIESDFLSDNQKEIVEKSLTAKDYFLIQGPPGTGKTKYVLKAIIEHLYYKTEQNILILAYTNRAVDEICSTMIEVENSFFFLRTGSKESSEHEDFLISVLSDKFLNEELLERVKKTRVFVSTVSSVLTNPEILDLKNFQVAIIDEASQILEPQIVGILTSVEKFILIGDEKQLPAVVVQDEIHLKYKGEKLQNIHLNNLGVSLFERLLLCSKQNGWNNAYGMLIKQARMHREIEEFPNKYFYNNQLEPFRNDGWQFTKYSELSSKLRDSLKLSFDKSRVLFVPSKGEQFSNINCFEAGLVNYLTSIIYHDMGDDFDEDTIGIISPFRAQCSEIYRRMSPELRKKINIDTIERFQGSEKKIIIISFAVNSEHRISTVQSIVNFNGCDVDRKLNVAMTRAKEYLVITGNPDILKFAPMFRNLIEHIKQKDGYIYPESIDFVNEII